MSAQENSTLYTFLHDPNYIATQAENLINAIANQQNVSYFTPANPTGTTSTTGVMMGLALTFTPKKTGRVKVYVSFNITNNTAGDGATAQLAYGTGTAPTNGAAVTGTAIGQAQSAVAASASQPEGITLVAVVTGLTVGTAYWFDVILKAVTGGTASISSIMAVIEEF